MAHRKLTDRDIEKTVLLLDAWTGKLTWNRFLAVLETEIGRRYSKTAMHNHVRIKDAYSRAKVRIRNDGSGEGKAPKHGDYALAHAFKKIDTLQNRIDRLTAENVALLERFRCWYYNAMAHGMTEEQLDRPLPRIHADS